MGKRIAPLAIRFGREKGKVVSELAVGIGSGDMERLLIQNNGCQSEVRVLEPRGGGKGNTDCPVVEGVVLIVYLLIGN